MKDNYSLYINLFYPVVFLRSREIFSKFEYNKPFFSIPVYTLRSFNLGLPEGNCYFLLIKKQKKTRSNSWEFFTMQLYLPCWNISIYLRGGDVWKIKEIKKKLPKKPKKYPENQHCIFSIDFGKCLTN